MKQSTQMFADASTRRLMEPAAAPEQYQPNRSGARDQLARLVQQVMRREAREIMRREVPRTNLALMREIEAALLNARTR